MGILEACHSSPFGGHFGAQRTAAKVLQCGFYWPSLFKDSYIFVKTCNECNGPNNFTVIYCRLTSW